MPKVVDHEERRRAVAEALWRVVRREGIEHASVRNVATEAGLSPGAMRHYFAGQLDLQRAAMRALMERIAERLRAIPSTGEPVERCRAALAQLLPLDDERQAEAEIWFAFAAQARTQPAFEPLVVETYDAIWSIAAEVVSLVAPGLPPARHAAEAEALFALVDGLVLHAVQRPGLVDADAMLAVVDAQLAHLRRAVR
ncbi:TetR family transcriptional regulator C-terminal domain-containing protein [Patulibacter brassicae]|uniref:TetR family transcriptional regulator C-terminal domain-containing protein n=1 Tax=Patulibacter brassicae TaxID=1705717 RepID=A0ABU4VIQ0_9ACTN|nr:TetR family transcriptional regulator C-terminal domain-containing protein [Patulibacter brassicae]MDX8151663.1 TetR family transcriptional regulator C-terminal domain-containing protein [Patulibacter brassicae]